LDTILKEAGSTFFHAGRLGAHAGKNKGVVDRDCLNAAAIAARRQFRLEP
jgi:hypothetical protein